MVPGYECSRSARQGLMIASSRPGNRCGEGLMERARDANKGLFCQLIPCRCSRPKILTQVSGHGSHTIKLLAAVSSPKDALIKSVDTVIASSHKVPARSGRSARRWWITVREIGVAVTSSLRERSDEAIHSSFSQPVDCFAALSMTS